MKRINLAIVCMAVATMCSCGGNAQAPKASMNDLKDSLSYSIGMGRAVRVYKDQLPQDVVDSTTIKSFIKGFLEAAGNTDDKAKLAYALGYEIGNQEMTQAFVGLSDQLFGGEETFNKDNYISAFVAGLADDWSVMSFEDADETANRLYEEFSKRKFEETKQENLAWLEKKALEEGVIKTESGLLYEVVSQGDGGAKPSADSDVEVRYHGELIDGTMFDESTEPITLNLGGVIKGWTEGLQLMSVGDKYRFYLPYNLAYGEQGQGQIKPYSTLIFDVELVNIK